MASHLAPTLSSSLLFSNPKPRTLDLTRQSPLGRTRRKDIHSASASTSLPPFKLFEPQQVDESPFPPDLEPADPDFYKIGYARSVRAYGVDFMEGPNGFGVYASRDVEPLRRARQPLSIASNNRFCFAHRSLKGLPPGTIGWPLFGETIEFLKQGPNFMKNQRARYMKKGLPPGTIGWPMFGETTEFLKQGPNFMKNQRARRTLVYAVNQDAEKSFKKTLEVDRLIDTLRVSNPGELEQLVVENVLAFNEAFWIRLAARTVTCKSDDDKKDYEELAASVMSIVDRLVHKANEKIESATDILKAILRPVVDGVREVSWPPQNPDALKLMEEEVHKREREGQLDEGFLAEVNAQLRQATEDGDKPGLAAMLQKVLQLYASKFLGKRSYAYKGGEVLKAEKFLESIIEAPEESWDKLLIEGLNLVSPEELYAVIKKRIERVLIRTEGGSYQQRILTEYLKGIQIRTEGVVQALKGSQQ